MRRAYIDLTKLGRTELVMAGRNGGAESGMGQTGEGGTRDMPPGGLVGGDPGRREDYPEYRLTGAMT